MKSATTLKAELGTHKPLVTNSNPVAATNSVKSPFDISASLYTLTS